MSCLSNVVIVNGITETASVSRLENLDGIHLQGGMHMLPKYKIEHRCDSKQT